MTITTGVVSFEDGVKSPEDYAPAKKVRVELTFTVGEGEDAEVTLDRVAGIARRKVDEMLGRTPVAEPKKQSATDKIKEKTRAARAEAPAQVEAPAAEEQEVPAGEPAGPPQTGNAGEEQTLDDGLDWAEEEPAAPVAVITDADLNHAVQRKNAEIKSPRMIRDVIDKYNPDPTKIFQLRGLPQEVRRAFLDDIAALKLP